MTKENSSLHSNRKFPLDCRRWHKVNPLCRRASHIQIKKIYQKSRTQDPDLVNRNLYVGPRARDPEPLPGTRDLGPSIWDPSPKTRDPLCGNQELIPLREMRDIYSGTLTLKENLTLIIYFLFHLNWPRIGFYNPIYKNELFFSYRIHTSTSLVQDA